MSRWLRLGWCTYLNSPGHSWVLRWVQQPSFLLLYPLPATPTWCSCQKLPCHDQDLDTLLGTYPVCGACLLATSAWTTWSHRSGERHDPVSHSAKVGGFEGYNGVFQCPITVPPLNIASQCAYEQRNKHNHVQAQTDSCTKFHKTFHQKRSTTYASVHSLSAALNRAICAVQDSGIKCVQGAAQSRLFPSPIPGGTSHYSPDHPGRRGSFRTARTYSALAGTRPEKMGEAGVLTHVLALPME